MTQGELCALRAEHLERALRGDQDAGAAAAEIAALMRRREARYRTGEILDIYDDSLRPLGHKDRGLVHLDGDWHRSIQIWLVSPTRRTVLVQRRAASKRTFPLFLDTSVAGHYRQGEDVAEGCREAEEELGLRVDPGSLLPLGRVVQASRHGPLQDREVADVFLARSDVDPADLRPDPTEVEELVELPIAAGLRLFRGEVQAVWAWAIRPGTPPWRVRVRADEFTLHLDPYYVRIFWQARRVAMGRMPLPF